MQLQFIPARGRKPWWHPLSTGLCAVAIYPREGTETQLLENRDIKGKSCNLSPRGDGNKGRFPLSTGAGSCNLSPRGDGNRSRRWVPWPALGLQFIPARGRKHFPFVYTYNSPCVAIYPREGTETIHGGGKPQGARLQFIPARGRKLQGCSSSLSSYQRCNLSPRGDGNGSDLIPCCSSMRLQFIPARGRKRSLCFSSFQFFKLQFIPARGRKLSYKKHFSVNFKLQFIPARGRKPACRAGRAYHGRKLQFIPARGRKLSTMLSESSRLTGCNLSPRGDGNLCARHAYR